MGNEIFCDFKVLSVFVVWYFSEDVRTIVNLLKYRGKIISYSDFHFLYNNEIL